MTSFEKEKKWAITRGKKINRRVKKSLYVRGNANVRLSWYIKLEKKERKKEKKEEKRLQSWTVGFHGAEFIGRIIRDPEERDG